MSSSAFRVPRSTRGARPGERGTRNAERGTRMPDDQKPLTVPDLREKKRAGEKLAVLTCYDALFARLLDGVVDILLVGDSLNQVLAGHPTTLNATLDQMIYH